VRPEGPGLRNILLTTDVIPVPAGGGTESFVNVILLIAPGSAPNVELIEVGHVTVNANGVATVSFDGVTGGCRG
jgi:hypothetical protein